MKMKKSALILASLFSVILVSGLVAAIQPAPQLPAANPLQGISDLLVGAVKVIGDVFGALTGRNPLGLGELVFTRIMIFLLLTVVLYMPTKSMIIRDNEYLALFAAAIVSLLGARFIDDNMITAILLPYGTLAITMSCLIPLVMYGAFITAEGMPKWVRKIGWWLFFAAFLGLYIWRSAETAEDGGLTQAGQSLYALFALFALIGAYGDSIIIRWYRLQRNRLQKSKEEVASLQGEVNKMKTSAEEKEKELRREIEAGNISKAEIKKQAEAIAKMQRSIEIYENQLAPRDYEL